MSGLQSQSRKPGWLQAWSGRYLHYPSVLVLIATNLIPLYGVLHWGWDLYVLMTVYWMETGIIGFWTGVRLTIAAKWAAVVMVPFFIVHFGGFMAAHFVFLWAMFAGDWTQQVAGVGDFVRVIVFGTGLWLAFVALFGSHGTSFFLNVLRPMLRSRSQKVSGGNPRTDDPSETPALTPQQIMMTPYGRVIVMHMTILAGAFLVHVFQTRVAAFVLLIALKIALDVAAHVRKNFAALQLTTQ